MDLGLCSKNKKADKDTERIKVHLLILGISLQVVVIWYKSFFDCVFSSMFLTPRICNPLQCSCLENPRDGEPGGLLSMGSHRVRHDWSDLAAAAHAKYIGTLEFTVFYLLISPVQQKHSFELNACISGLWNAASQMTAKFCPHLEGIR